jgi:hypothetical protein
MQEKEAKDIEIPNISWKVFELMMRWISHLFVLDSDTGVEIDCVSNSVWCLLILKNYYILVHIGSPLVIMLYMVGRACFFVIRSFIILCLSSVAL